MGLTDYFVRERSKEKKEPEVKNTAGGESSTPSAPQIVIRDKEGEEGVDLIDALLSGKEIATTFDTKYGDFQFRFPSGSDQITIAHRIADYQGGRPSDAFDNMRRYQFERWATLDVLICSKPPRLSMLKSWADFPDQALVEDLYDRGFQFCSSIRKKIRGNDSGRVDAGGASGNS